MSPRWTKETRDAERERARRKHAAGKLKGRPPKWGHLGTMMKISANWPVGVRERLIERLGLPPDAKDQAIIDILIIEPIYKEEL